MNSEELFIRSKKVAPGGVHSPVRSFKGLDRAPIFFKSGSGAYLTSVEGQSYIDFCQSFGPLILGHRDPDVQAVVEDTVKLAWSFGACEPYSLELAEWIQAQIPFVEKMRFVSSGTEAVMSAVRLARGYTGRNLILKFDGCYHGHVDSLLVKAGSGLAGTATSSSAGITPAQAQDTLIADLNNEAQVTEIFAQHGQNIAAVIIEPLPANYGLLIQRQEFLQHLARLCKKNGSLLIFDEVISGFRVGLRGMAGLLDIVPDLVTYGKIIGGGFPVGCYGGRSEIMDMVAPLGSVYQAGTLSANPIGMRAGLATLKKMQDLDGWNLLNERSAKFVKNMNEIFSQFSIGTQVIGFASLFWLHSDSVNNIRTIAEIPQDNAEKFKKIFLAGLQQGLYLAPNSYEVGFLSLAHSENILQLALDKMATVARQVSEK